MDLSLQFDTEFLPEGGFYSEDGDASESSSWITSSGARGLIRFSIPLVGADDEPAIYTLRLHFAAGDGAFDVHVQGKLVEDLDQANSSLLLENVEVNDNLVIDLAPKAETPTLMPVLTAIEVVRTRSL